MKSKKLKNNYQQKQWAEKFGKEYILRNPKSVAEMDALYFKNYKITRTALNKEFLSGLNKESKILEVGSNVGVQLLFLQKMGFFNLYGIEINRKAIEISKSLTKNINIIESSALDIPFKDNYFDMVFTSGVLIHIAPSNIKKAMSEIYRCSKKYIFGFEYYSENCQEIQYRGNNNMLWKNDFAKLYLKFFKDLKLVKEKKIHYLADQNIDAMFLLKKNG